MFLREEVGKGKGRRRMRNRERETVKECPPLSRLRTETVLAAGKK